MEQVSAPLDDLFAALRAVLAVSKDPLAPFVEAHCLLVERNRASIEALQRDRDSTSIETRTHCRHGRPVAGEISVRRAARWG